MTRLEIAARIAAGMATNGNYSASDIARFSLRVADELIRLEAETRPKPEPEPEHELPFEMVLGGVYLDRKGRIEEIVIEFDRPSYPFNGKSGRCYTKEGAYVTNKESEFDLIKRIR